MGKRMDKGVYTVHSGLNFSLYFSYTYAKVKVVTWGMSYVSHMLKLDSSVRKEKREGVGMVLGIKIR